MVPALSLDGERMDALEVKVAFQEHTIAQLDEVVQELRSEVEALRREVAELREQQSLGPEDPDQKPPHY